MYSYKFFDQADNLILAAHDYGAAIQLYHLAKYSSKKIYLSFKGIAESLLNESDKNYNFFEIIKTIPKSRLIIITGSGWQTDYELKIIEYAKANGINYVVTIDHWINIKKRFGEDTETEIPENLLVFDEFTGDTIKSLFPRVKVHILPNYYLIGLKEIYEKSQNKIKNKDSLLYLSEPLRFNFSIKKNDLVNFVRLKIKEFECARIIFRKHPIQIYDDKIFNILKNEFGSILIENSESTLNDNLATAKICMGYQSYSLFIASRLGIPSFTIGNFLNKNAVFPKNSVI